MTSILGKQFIQPVVVGVEYCRKRRCWVYISRQPPERLLRLDFHALRGGLGDILIVRLIQWPFGPLWGIFCARRAIHLPCCRSSWGQLVSGYEKRYNRIR